MRAKLESSAFCGWRYRTCWILLWKLVTGKRNQDEQTTEKSLENLRCGRLFVNNFRPGLATVSVIWNPLTNYHIWSFRSTQPWFSFFFDIQHRDDEKCDKTETTSTRVEFDDVHARDLLEIPRKYNRICKHSPITDAIVVSIFPLGWKENYRCHDSELCSENVTSRDWHMKVEGVGCLARVGVWEGTVVNMT